MPQWIEGLVGPEYALPAMAALAAVVALLVLILLWRLLRSGGGSGTFVAGGRNRKARLAVMDATAIDNYRRLVLVRRDDVEHLLLIGGSADVVVESNIRLSGSSVRAAPVQEPIYDQPDDEPVYQPSPAPQAPVMRPPASRPPQPVQTQIRPAQPRVEARSAPMAPARPVPPTRPLSTPAPVAHQSIDDAFDDDLMRELEIELDADTQPSRARRSEASVDDEMSKLLGEMSPNRR